MAKIGEYEEESAELSMSRMILRNELNSAVGPANTDPVLKALERFITAKIKSIKPIEGRFD
jgi:hypothetical protein